MITLLMGENNYEIQRAVAALATSFDGIPEKVDGEELELGQLPDLISGGNLFAENRLIIIRDISKNKQLWEVLPDFLERAESDVVLVESAVDKRTKTYKALQKNAEVKEFQLLGERDTAEAQRWLFGEAKSMGIKLDSNAAKELLRRSMIISPKGQPVLDQWQARHALEKLAVFGDVSIEHVELYIDDQPSNTVFSIFETTLKGDEAKLWQLLESIKPREDAFRVFGLLSGQVFQLAALHHSKDISTAETAKAIGVHPYAAGKLSSYAKRLSDDDIQKIVQAFSEADEDMKLSKAEPWVLIERALVKTARVI